MPGAAFIVSDTRYVIPENTKWNIFCLDAMVAALKHPNVDSDFIDIALDMMVSYYRSKESRTNSVSRAFKGKGLAEKRDTLRASSSTVLHHSDNFADACDAISRSDKSTVDQINKLIKSINSYNT